MISTGASISIINGGAVAHSAVVSALVHVMVTNESEKAIQITGDSKTSIWVPRKALVVKGDGLYALAHWFRPSYVQQRWLDKNTSYGGVSNAS
jgi:hypothetical protein